VCVVFIHLYEVFSPINILFPKVKISLGKKPITKPSNPFTTKQVTLRVPALKVKAPKLGFRLRLPFTRS
jgi:hypothetical protein